MHASRLAVLLVAVLATSPVLAQKQSLADRVARLEQQSANEDSAGGRANVELLNRLTQMQTEVQALRNQLEQLQNENEQLKQRNREQYVDLDTRLQRMEGAGASAPAPPASGSASPTRPSPAAASGAARPASRPAPAGPDDQAAYSAALDSLKAGDYVASARGFQAYLAAYPQGALAPNAWYWLGESYYGTQNFPLALQAFQSLLSQFPDSAKAPDALLKKGYSQIETGQRGAGEQTLNRVITDFPGSPAAGLAASRLRALSLESR